MSNEDFWNLTPAQFYSLSKRYDADRKGKDLGFGIVASVIANCHRNPKKRSKAFEPKDFMPSYENKTQKNSKELFNYWNTMVVSPHNNKQKLRKKKNV